MISRKAIAATAVAMSFAAQPAAAEDADYYRGGWRTDAGEPQIYQFVIDGGKVSGYYCTHCADGTTLAPLEGTFDAEGGLSFTVRHLDLNGATVSTARLRGKLANGKLQLTGTGGDGQPLQRVAIKDPRGPDAAPFLIAILPPNAPPVPIVRNAPVGGGSGGAPAPYVQPAPWRQLTADDIVGVWLGFGVGMNKQYFVIRRDGERLFGLACGRCDNPYTHGALDSFRIEGDTLKFDIRHEDWAEGNRLPFTRRVTAHIAMNEMRMDARRDDAPDRPGIVASLVGPISLEATKGNVVGE